jgi:hypothetical protein
MPGTCPSACFYWPCCSLESLLTCSCSLLWTPAAARCSSATLAAARCSSATLAAAHCSVLLAAAHLQLLTALNSCSCSLLLCYSCSCSLLCFASSCSLLPDPAVARCSAVAAHHLTALLSAAHFTPAHFFYLLILCIRCYLKVSAWSTSHGGGEADMRPLSLVEVNQAILAWSSVPLWILQRQWGVLLIDIWRPISLQESAPAVGCCSALCPLWRTCRCSVHSF